MKEIKRETSTTLQLDIGTTPDDDPTVTLYHEWGGIIAENISTTNTTGTIWSVDLSSTHTKSAGVTKAKFIYEVSGDESYRDLYFSIFTPYVDRLSFFNNHPELEEEFDDSFVLMEKKTREIINTYCGQDFDYRFDKTLTLDGSGTRNLYLPLRLDSFTGITIRSDDVDGITVDDFTDYVQVHPETKYFLRMKSIGAKFGNNSEFVIEGNWGWPYVPQNVTDAADYIIEDLMNDDSTYRQHGVAEVYQDTHRMRFSDSIFGSTGNMDADVLLMDYTLFILSLI